MHFNIGEQRKMTPGGCPFFLCCRAPPPPPPPREGKNPKQKKNSLFEAPRPPRHFELLSTFPGTERRVRGLGTCFNRSKRTNGERRRREFFGRGFSFGFLILTANPRFSSFSTLPTPTLLLPSVFFSSRIDQNLQSLSNFRAPKKYTTRCVLQSSKQESKEKKKRTR